MVALLQIEEFPWEEGKPKPTTPEEVFAEEDRKKEMVQGNSLLIFIKLRDICYLWRY